MEEVFVATMQSHRGFSYSTVVLFGVYIFLLIQTLFSYSGQITNVLRKIGFFTMGLVFIQVILEVLMMVYADSFQLGERIRELKLTVGNQETTIENPAFMLLVGGLLGVVYRYIKIHEKLPLKILVLALSAALIFEYVFPWSKMFN